MTHQELCDKLIGLGFLEGWAIRDGKIVVWENTAKVPNELKQYIDLD